MPRVPAKANQPPSLSAAAADDLQAGIAKVVEAEIETEICIEPGAQDFLAYLESMPEADLRNEFRRLNLPELHVQGPAALRERLMQWAHWTHMSRFELEAECAEAGVPAEEVADSNDAAENTDEACACLRNLLLAHVWCIPEYGLPLERIRTAEQILHLVHTLEGYVRLDRASLTNAWAALGFPSHEGGPREELLARLQMILFWNALPADELRKECWERELLYEEAGESLTRDDLLQFLYSAMCPSSRVPVERFASAEEACAVARQFILFEQMPITRLREMLNEFKLPLQGGLEKTEYVYRLQRATIWYHFSSAELEKECRELEFDLMNFIPHAVRDNGDCEDHRRDQLLELLLSWLVGVPIHRFNRLSEIIDIADQFSTLQLLTLTQLRDQCEKMNVPLQDGTIQDYTERLQYATLYLALPTSELERECEQWDISLSRLHFRGHGVDFREELLEVLFCSLNSVPIGRLGSLGAISSVGEQYITLQRMSLQELKRQCADWLMPVKPDTPTVDLVGLLQYAVLWWELPAPELEKEIKEWNLPVPLSLPRETVDDKRARLLDHLLFALCWDAFRSLGVWIDNLDSFAAACNVHEEFKVIDALSSVGLRARYATTSLHADDALGNEER